MQTLALVMDGSAGVECRKVDIPLPGPDELLVDVFFSAVSPGTEVRCFLGRQEGLPAGGFIPGYSASGVVRESGTDCRIQPGTKVFLKGTERAGCALSWGGHCRLAVVSESSVFPLDERADLFDAALAKPAAISRRGIRLASVGVGDRVVVVGLGLIGHYSARIAALAGAHVTGIDPNARRRDFLALHGVESAPLPSGPEEAGAYAADVIVDATGVPAALAANLGYAKELGWGDEPGTGVRYVVQGSYVGDFSIPYGWAFFGETSFLIPRDCRSEDIRDVLQFQMSGGLSLREPAALVARPSDAPDVYAGLMSGDPAFLTAIFDWRE